MKRIICFFLNHQWRYGGHNGDPFRDYGYLEFAECQRCKKVEYEY